MFKNVFVLELLVFVHELPLSPPWCTGCTIDLCGTDIITRPVDDQIAIVQIWIKNLDKSCVYGISTGGTDVYVAQDEFTLVQIWIRSGFVLNVFVS